MRSLNISILILGVGALLQSSSGKAEIYDGGTFSNGSLRKSDWSADAVVHGTSDPANAPTITKASGEATTVDQDRAEFALVSRPLFSLDKDGNCFKSNFAKTAGGVALVIYSKSPVSAEHCVYSTEARKDGDGYAIVARNGGVCVPVKGSLFDGDNGKPEWNVTEAGQAVSLKNCFDHTKTFAGRLPSSSVESSRLGFSKAVEHANMDITGSTDVNLLKEANQVAINNEPKGEAVVTAKDPGASMPVAKPVDLGTFSPTRYTVQLASFLSEDDAKNKITWLKSHDLESFEMIATVNGMTRYRVCVGHYPDKKEAKSSVPEILKKSGFTAAVVQKLDSADEVGAALPQAENHLANAVRAVNNVEDATKVNPEGAFTVFISSHLKDSDAQEKLEALKQKGIAAYEAVEHKDGETRYRILTGHYASMKEAQKALPKIAKQTGDDGLVVEPAKDAGEAGAH